MSKRILSVLLCVVLIITSVFSCYAEEAEVSAQNNSTTEVAATGEAALKATESITKGNAPTENGEKKEAWENYIGDIETFVYGLIISEFQYVFDVFPASVKLPDETEVCGIAYTDYSKCYSNDDETECCFEAGFVPFIGELDVSQEYFDSGLFVNDLEYSDDNTSFVWVYASDQIKEHCVVYGQYLKYGIDEHGKLFYEASEYVPGVCDESLGSLYSYDEGKYLFDIDVGTYQRISGESLFNQIDFKRLEDEVNEIIRNQEIKFGTVDTVSCAYFAQDAIVSYLLSLQEETFLGYSVPALIEAAKSLDPLECYRITADGIKVLQLDEDTQASDVMKWIVGTTCVILMAVSVVGSFVTIECPGLPMVFGAVGGTAVEIFMQVVVSGKDLSCVDWRKVALCAATAAVSVYIGGYIHGEFEGLAYFAIDTIADGLMAGIERAAEAWMDGEDATEIIKSFGSGVAMGMAISACFKGAGKILSAVGKKIGPKITKVATNLIPKLTNKVSAAKKAISKILYSLKEVADSSPFHSDRMSKKIAERQLKRLVSENVDEFMDNSIKRLGVKNMVNVDKEEMTKEMLKKLAIDANDGDLLGYFKYDDELVSIVKKNSIIGIEFDPSKYQSVIIPNGLTADRSINFSRAAEIYKKQWLQDSSKIPDSISKAINKTGIDLEEMMPEKLVELIKGSDFVMHENIDKLSITLAPRAIHEKISHMGGVALEQYIKSHMGKEFFDRLVSVAATGAILMNR